MFRGDPCALMSPFAYPRFAVIRPDFAYATPYATAGTLRAGYLSSCSEGAIVFDAIVNHLLDDQGLHLRHFRRVHTSGRSEGHW